MPDINWDDIIQKAKTETDNKFKTKMSSLTTLTNNDIEALISDTGIKKEEFAKVVKILKDAAASNDQKTAALKNITKALQVVVGIASKII
jgi:DNA-binding transcriptional regulator YiaG